MTLNIRNNDDPFERYKMPDIEFRIKHQGNYHNTYIINLLKISKAINISHKVLTKFLGISLSTQAKFNEDTKELQLKGTFTYEVLLKTLRQFIDDYILCDICTYPELNFIVKKKKLFTKCRACGNRKECIGDRIHKIIFVEVSENPLKYQKIKKETLDNEEVKIPLDNEEVKIDESLLSNEEIEKRKEEMMGESKLMKSLFE